MQSRTCKVCGEEKPINKYAIATGKTGKPYHRWECDTCHSARHLAWREKNRDHLRQQATERMKKWRAAAKAEDVTSYLSKEAKKMRERNKRIKLLVYENYGGFLCACCGEKEPMFLSIDHKNNDGYAHRKMIKNGTTNGITLYNWIYGQFKKTGIWPDGFQILCMNCQHGKARNGGICPHQVRCND